MATRRTPRPATAADAVSAARPPRPVDGIRVGIGGWTFADWRGVFYPKGLVQRRELEYASRHLTSIEINGTYYGLQKPATYAKWRDETPDGFLFSAKAPKRIVESRTLANTGGQIDDFIGGIVELRDRLGPLVWQFDARPTLEADDFEAFLHLLPEARGGRPLRHVVDVRDTAFVDARLLAMARARGVATVFTDSPEHPSFADITTDFVYARLMRSQADVATGYDTPALAQWAERARRWSAGGEAADLPNIESSPASYPAAGKRDVFVYFIGAAKHRNPAAAMALQAALESGAG